MDENFYFHFLISVIAIAGVNIGKLKKASNFKLLDSQPGVYTSYKWALYF